MEITCKIYCIKIATIIVSAAGLVSICSDLNARKLVSQKLMLDNDINRYSWTLSLRKGYGLSHRFRPGPSYDKDFESLTETMKEYSEDILLDMHDLAIIDMNRVVIPEYEDESINRIAVDYKTAIEQYNKDAQKYYQLEHRHLTLDWLNSMYLWLFLIAIGLQFWSTILEHKSLNSNKQ